MTIDDVLWRWGNARMRYAAVENHNYGPPANDVLLELTQSYQDGHWEGPGPSLPPPVRLHLPLSPDQPWDVERLASGAPGYRSGLFQYHGYVYSVLYWIGPDAPAADKAAVLRALRSIRPAS